MHAAIPPNDEQATLWNSTAGQAWVDGQATLDAMLQPFEDLLVEHARPGERVLDIGCGTGSTTLALTRRAGSATGIDISAPMIELARTRAQREGSAAAFILGDAQSHDLEPAGYDRIVSRFGVMFFDDPVRAFANLRRAARPDAPLLCVVWRSAAENPFMTTAERAAAPLLPDLPPRRPDAPGQFAFADDARVARILEASGWRDVAIRPLDLIGTLPEADLTRYVSRMGPVGQALHGLDETRRRDVVTMVRAAFDGFVEGDTVRIPTACWQVEARA